MKNLRHRGGVSESSNIYNNHNHNHHNELSSLKTPTTSQQQSSSSVSSVLEASSSSTTITSSSNSSGTSSSLSKKKRILSLSSSQLLSSGNVNNTDKIRIIIIILLSNLLSFYSGMSWAIHYSCSSECSSSAVAGSSASTSTALPLVLDKTSRYASGLARVKKEDFLNQMDIGVPLDHNHQFHNSNRKAPFSASISSSSSEEEEDVLILYSRSDTFPTAATVSSSVRNNNSLLPSLLETNGALKNCDYVNIILTHNGPTRKQCIAVVPQFESYHVFKYARVPPRPDDGDDPNTATMNRRLLRIDNSSGLRMIPRGYVESGKFEHTLPSNDNRDENWRILQTYFESLPQILEDLKPILAQIAYRNKIVVAMVCNFGQSELLFNFVCAAKYRNLDLSNIIVFVTDTKTKEIVESIGLKAYYNQRNFEKVPARAARGYGDPTFVSMMIAKVISVHAISLLGYDVLYQDVDMIWYQNPVEFFWNTIYNVPQEQKLKQKQKQQNNNKNDLSSFDVYFQDDGARGIRYAPYSANTGFYYVRNNERSNAFLYSVVLSCDQILATGSHQQAVGNLLSEHASLYGLRVKVFGRNGVDTAAARGSLMFLGGYHYHEPTGKYMRALFSYTRNNNNKIRSSSDSTNNNINQNNSSGSSRLSLSSSSPPPPPPLPYSMIFHMSWTKNKQNKILFLQQMGEWYVYEHCIHKTVQNILDYYQTTITNNNNNNNQNNNNDVPLVPSCCSRNRSLFSCHYRDKPSIQPCKDSPPLDKGKPSWWK